MLTLQNLLESTVDRRAHRVTLVEVNGGKSTLANALRSELELLVHLLVRSRGTETVETELLVRVALPAHGRGGLNGEDGDVVGENLELVLLRLSVEDFEARNGDDTGDDTVLLFEGGGGFDGDADLGTGGDQSDSSVGGVDSDVGTLDGGLDGRVLQLGQVLTGEGEDGGGVLGGQSHVVGSAGLVAVGGTPDHAVGEGTEVSEGLNGLVSRTVLTQTDGVVGSDVDDTDAREGRETDGTGGVGDEVQEGTGGGDNGTVGSETVHDGSHGVLTDTVAEVAAGPLTNTVLRGLEVDGVLPAGVVGASQVSRAGDELGDDVVDLLKDSLAQLTRSNGSVAGLVCGEALLPTLGELARETADEVIMLGLVLRGVLLEELVPLLLLGSTLGGVLVVEVVDLLGNDEALLGVETEERLDTLAVIGLEGVTVDTTGTLELGTETNGGGELDDGRLVSDLLALADGSLDGLKVVVTVLDVDGVPAVGFITLHDVLGESTLGVTVYSISIFFFFPKGMRVHTNGDTVVIVDGNEVTKLQVTSHRGSLAGNTLHSTAVTEETVGVVVEEVIAGLVEGTSSLGLGNGKTNGVGETLTKRTSGDLNTGGVVSFGVTGSLAVELLQESVHLFVELW